MESGGPARTTFEDEWLARAVTTRLGVARQAVAWLRAGGRAHLSESLLAEGLATKDELSRALLDEYRIRTISPVRERVGKFAATLVPESMCRRRGLLPLSTAEDRLEVAMANPLDAEALEDVRSVAGRTPVPFYCLPSEVSALVGSISGAAAPAAAPARAAERRPCVVVAEDDAPTRLLLRLALERGGCEAIEAADGREALERIARADLLLTDLNMPNMDGAELIGRLRGDAATRGLPVIVLTSESDDLSQQRVLEAGADDYIVKPYKAPLLIARVKAALRRRAAAV